MNKKTTLLTFSLLLGSSYAFSQIANAQAYSLRDTTNLNEVIINQNRLQIPFSKQTRNIQIITKEDIKRFPARSINELLAYISGVDIRQRGPFGSQADVNIDGGTFEQTLILLNGAKISDPQTAHHSLNLPIPTDAIERIEIIKGPASRIYGINSLTGAINIVTKTAESNLISAQVYAGSSFEKSEDAQHGKYYGKGIQLGFANKMGHFGQQLYLGHEDSNGQRYNTASKNNKIYYQGNYTPNSNNEVSTAVGYIDNQFGANGFYAAPGDKESYELVKTAFATLQSKHQLGKRFTLSPRISNRYNEDDYRYLRHDLTKARSKHYNNAFMTELNAVYEQDYGSFGIGVESRFENINSSNIGRHSRENYGGYFEFKTEMIKNLLINIGTYVNYNSDYSWQVFPGIDLGYEINNQWKLVFNAGSSQRIPSFTDLYLNQRPANIGNPALTSERARQVEGAVKYADAHIIAHAGYFYRTINDFIDWTREVNTEPWQPQNMDKNEVQGFNFNFRLDLNDPVATTKYYTTLGYNYLHPKVKDATMGNASKYAIESLRHQANVNFTVSHKEWSLTTANRFNERISYKSYFISDIRLSHNIAKLNLYVDAQNLFNVKYIEAGAVPMPGTWYTMGIKYSMGY
ncbi:TonB-dependent receptor [Sphingobacterium sp. SRCM116780]|uniref:TonB-dependent receptor plug domain-containing protein n=1 Tax=Sphingobacterium sp. SRCM116780 TaxID=2907623 RepID=UPI001F33CCE0|nr:TonB-dependent receptor [Sphingobacterium sp. SRCM116780]UIR57736.1 TonB-dependent receptor [Sphingobacterium sp. SRCM116780]